MFLYIQVKTAKVTSETPHFLRLFYNADLFEPLLYSLKGEKKTLLSDSFQIDKDSVMCVLRFL